MIKFLPSFVGSKSYWVNKLDFLKDRKIVELFAGSAVLSANYAKTCILYDTDPFICNILRHFDRLVVIDPFTKEDYFYYRAKKDWWKYSYMLQKMSFSGVFRYSKNGFNVPVKKNLVSISLENEYLNALERWYWLAPKIENASYETFNIINFSDWVLILDPPYQSSQTVYTKNFNHKKYWNFVDSVIGRIDLLIFDTEMNLNTHKITPNATRKLRVNGKYQGGVEAVSFIPKCTILKPKKI